MELVAERPRGSYMMRECVEFYLFSRWRPSAGGEQVAMSQPIVMVDLTPETMGLYQQPAFSLKNEAAQKLMDSLWECGLRPTQGAGSAGSLAATERHLADVRAVAWHALKMNGGGK